MAQGLVGCTVHGLVGCRVQGGCRVLRCAGSSSALGVGCRACGRSVPEARHAGRGQEGLGTAFEAGMRVEAIIHVAVDFDKCFQVDAELLGDEPWRLDRAKE